MEEEELFCAVCSEPVHNEDEICRRCGTDLQEYEDKYPSQSKYKTLFRLLEIIRIFAGVAAGISLIGLLYGIYVYDFFLIISAFLEGFYSMMAFFAIEIVKLFIDLEQNSRMQIKLMNKFLLEKGN